MNELSLSGDEKIATVIGGTGLVGTALLRLLCKHDAYEKVFCISRNKPQIQVDKLVWIKLAHSNDYTSKALEDRLEKLLPEGEDFFSCLGTTRRRAGSAEQFTNIDLHLNAAFAKTAYGKGYRQYSLVSSVGSNASSSFLYPRVKGQLELVVKSLPFWAVRIYKPSLLLGDRNETRIGERFFTPIMKVASTVFGKRSDKYRPVHGEEVANAMLLQAQKLKGGIQIVENEEILEHSLIKQIGSN